MKEGPSSAVEISEASQNLIMMRTVMAAVTDISSCPLLSDTYILETVLPLTLWREARQQRLESFSQIFVQFLLGFAPVVSVM